MLNISTYDLPAKYLDNGTSFQIFMKGANKCKPLIMEYFVRLPNNNGELSNKLTRYNLHPTKVQAHIKFCYDDINMYSPHRGRKTTLIM